jgi:hypothetical protein
VIHFNEISEHVNKISEHVLNISQYVINISEHVLQISEHVLKISDLSCSRNKRTTYFQNVCMHGELSLEVTATNDCLLSRLLFCVRRDLPSLHVLFPYAK